MTGASSTRISWPSIRQLILNHFGSEDRPTTFARFAQLPNNFFEGWFTAELAVRIVTEWPDAKVRSNMGPRGTSKPDLEIEYDGFACVLQIKHISTLHTEARNRWNGKSKNSTVVKDLQTLAGNGNNATVKKCLVFFGPADPNLHVGDSLCKRWIRCVDCSLSHLEDSVGSSFTAADYPLASKYLRLIEIDPPIASPVNHEPITR